MDHRYSLRFESGERRGETIPITPGGFVIGRKPGSSLQLVDNSVSGRHAELVVDAEGVLLRDLGSTNGTRVGELRVEERRLVHGDAVTLGNVAMRFLDRQLALDAPAIEALSKTKEVPAPDGVQRVSADVVARSKRVSRPGIALVALALVAGGVWWYLNRGGGQGSGPTLAAVTQVPGDALADEFSFEGDSDTWSAAEHAPQAFFRGSNGRRSGALGVACDLGAHEWALHRSRAIRVDASRELVVRGALRAQGGARARIGVELARSGADGVAIDAWQVWSAETSSGDFEERALAIAVPPGYDVARAVLLARASDAGGSAAADDVSLVERSTSLAPDAQIGAQRFHLAGAAVAAVGSTETPPAQATQLVITQGDRTLISGLELTSANAMQGQDGAVLSLAAEGPRVRVSASAPAAIVSLRCEAPLATGGIATIARASDPKEGGGYKTHSSTFERSGVTDVLLGSKSELVRVALKSPATVRAAPEGAGSASVRLTIDAGAPLSEITLQVEFKEERTHAGDLAHAARNAEKRGELGESLKQWSALLDTYPYETQLVEEAEASRARLLEKGLAELRALRAESERARFFRLADLFQQCRDKALAIGARFGGSEVEREAAELAAEVERDLSGLRVEREHAEIARLEAICKALEAQKATTLAAEVKSYLESREKRSATPGSNDAH